MNTTGDRVADFIEQHCVHTKGQDYRKPFNLLAWQREFLHELFEIDSNGRRRYKWALLGVPKGNGKSELIAALGLYFLLADGEHTPDVVCAASKTDQGKIIWDAARVMVEESSYSRAYQAGSVTLQDFVTTGTREISCPENRGRLRVLAGDSASIDSDDGGNFSAVLIDELHAWNKPKSILQWDTLTGGIIKRQSGMVIQITTAGVLDEDSLWWREYTIGTQIEEGLIDERDYYFKWYSAGNIDKEDYRSYEVAKRANPSLDHHLSWENIQSRQKRLTKNAYLRYHLNIATQSEETWIDVDLWERVPI